MPEKSTDEVVAEFEDVKRRLAEVSNASRELQSSIVMVSDMLKLFCADHCDTPGERCHPCACLVGRAIKMLGGPDGE